MNKPFEIPSSAATVSKTVRFPQELVARVENAIQGKSCSFSAFVVAAVRAALEDIEEQA